MAEPAQYVYPGKEWAVADSQHTGLSPGGLDSVRSYLATLQTTGLLVVHGGKVIFAYGDVKQTSYVASVRKSVLSMLYGIHLARGEIALDSTIAFYHVDDVGGLTVHEREATVKDLLEARSGVFHAASNPGDDVDSSLHRDSKPHGTYFIYNNWDFNALGTIFERATGRGIYDALDEEIARPIGMQDFQRKAQFKYGDTTRSRHPAYHMVLSARDMARIGYLMLRSGRWRDRQIVPRDWVAASTRAATHLQDMNPGRMREWWFGYGYLWWVYDGPRAIGPYAGGFTAMGAYGQFITVLPVIDMVIAHKTAVPPARNVDDNDYLRLVRRIVAAYHAPPE
jgi:CubicO group peptidase (beta-lactamase class C family)